MKSLKNHSVEAVMVLHVIDGSNYEVMDIGFDNKEFSALMEKCDSIYDSGIGDSLRDMACEDLYENGEVSTTICKELWKRDKTERFYCINVDLIYTITKDYFGEVDVDVDFNYEEIEDITKEWEKLDLLQKGTKIYPIDYEISKRIYMIDSVYEVHDNDYMKTGLYYSISNDTLSCLFQKHSLSIDSVDMDATVGRFFTTPSLAHEAYCYHLQNLNENEEISADEQER